MTVRLVRSDAQTAADIDETAAYWLARHDASADAERDPRFLDWLAASPDHDVAWARATRLWAQAAEATAQDPLADALRAAALASRADPWPRALLAACLVALIGGGGMVVLRNHRPAATIAAAAPQARFGAPDLVTAQGARLATTLPDGSRLQLDANSAVDLAFDGGRRQLRLVRGQVFVTVAPDKRPFSVEVADQTIIDQGTAFATRLDGGTVSVTLVSGRVAVGPHGKAPIHELAPGQRLVLRPGQPPIVQTVEVASALAWREGYIEFSDTPLSEAVEQLNQYGGQRLVIRDPKVAAFKITGRFRLGDPQRFVRTASAILPIVAVQTAQGLEIRRTPTPRAR